MKKEGFQIGDKIIGIKYISGDYPIKGQCGKIIRISDLPAYDFIVRFDESFESFGEWVSTFNYMLHVKKDEIELIK